MPEADHIRMTDPVGDLFSTAASDNAEVVPPAAAHGPESMWSTEANAVQVEEAVDGELLDEPAGGEVGGGATGHTNGHTNGFHDDRYGAQGAEQTRPRDPYGVPGARAGGVFSAEPVPRSDDVVDEDPAVAEVDRERAAYGAEAGMRSAGSTVRSTTPNGAPLFSSARAGATAADPWDRVAAQPSGPTGSPRSPFAPTAGPTTPTASPTNGHAARNAQQGPPQPPPPPAPDARSAAGLEGHLDAEGPDPNGLRAAVGRLHPEEVARASVPIAVCGALLHAEEPVRVAVTGQMLGRPAVVVVTDRRVLVVNDRRWQPIVDEFRIDSSLVVRGRHDRNVAALSFADPTRLAMVDGITDVALAIELAEHIRSAGTA